MPTPIWKVYDAQGKYQAALHEPEAAAALIGFYGDGATIRYDHKVTVWREGSEEIEAAESFDLVAAISIRRTEDHFAAKRAKRQEGQS